MNQQTPQETPLFYIKDRHIHSRVMLAPMAGVTDVVFRALVRHWAPTSLICTEMISSNGMIYSKQRKARILDHTESDHPIAYQLAGHRHAVLIEAAQQVIEDHDPTTIDLNMGCPVKKITGNFEGCALMKEPQMAADMVRALIAEIDRPVTIKCRLGWDFDTVNYLDFGKRMEEAGASMITLHARTRSQGYQPGVQWEAFGRLKQALSIPVTANGDINTLEDAETVLNDYGVDAVMIGRGCQGKPWLIGHIDHALKTGQHLPAFTLEEKLKVAMDHTLHLCDYRGFKVGMKEIRKHLAWYVEGFRGPAPSATN
ncbi:MAG: tRNA dihydrouridine synthase DusB [Vampirovibrionales bacterium]